MIPYISLISAAGVVPEPARQVAQEGAHEEGSWTAGAQCPAAELQRCPDSTAGAASQGAVSERHSGATVAAITDPDPLEQGAAQQAHSQGDRAAGAQAAPQGARGQRGAAARRLSGGAPAGVQRHGAAAGAGARGAAGR